MKKIRKTAIALLLAMVVLSFANIIAAGIGAETLKIAGLSVIVGVVAYFVTTDSKKIKVLDIKSGLSALKDTKVIILVLIPTIIGVITTILEKIFFPEYLEFLKSRVSFISTSQILVTILLLVVAALGEEIAWRAFFQKQISKIIPSALTLIIISTLFALGHFTPGNPIIVTYDLLFVFIDSIFFGLIFKKTNNVWCSWLAHFVANLIVVLMIGFS